MKTRVAGPDLFFVPVVGSSLSSTPTRFQAVDDLIKTSSSTLHVRERVYFYELRGPDSVPAQKTFYEKLLLRCTEQPLWSRLQDLVPDLLVPEKFL